ncbi:MAG: DegV family protein, partial [Anaerolineae bacterium]
MIRIVTDSSSDISPQIAAELGITVVPIRINFGSAVYHDNVDINQGEYYQLLSKSKFLPIAEPPSPEEFQRVYNRLLKDTDQILSIHISSRLNKTVQAAQEATRAFLGRSKITVFDSRMISWGLESLVVAAAEAAQRGMPVTEIVRLIRGMIPHIYMVFFTENLEYLERLSHPSRGRSLADGFLGSRPLLIVEEGEIIPLDKIRSRGRSVDRLFEFVAEFARFEKVVVLHGRPSDDAQMLFERLADAFPGKDLNIKSYGPALATYLGPEALGVVV